MALDFGNQSLTNYPDLNLVDESLTTARRINMLHVQYNGVLDYVNLSPSCKLIAVKILRFYVFVFMQKLINDIVMT